MNTSNISDTALTELGLLLDNLPNLIQKGSIININQDNGVINKKTFYRACEDIRAALPGAIREANQIRYNERAIIDGAHKYAKDTEMEVSKNRQLLEMALTKKQEEADNSVRQMLDEAGRRKTTLMQQAEEEARAAVNSAQKRAEEIVAAANDDAAFIINNAKAEAEKLVNDSQIMQTAKKKAEDFLQNAEYEIEDKFIQANNHIASLLDELEEYLLQKVKSIRVVKSQITTGNKNQPSHTKPYAPNNDSNFLSAYDEPLFEPGHAHNYEKPFAEPPFEEFGYEEPLPQEEKPQYFDVPYESVR